MLVEWKVYDRADKKATAPEPDVLVWIIERFYGDGTPDLGFFDGSTFRTWAGSDDCSVRLWAPIEYPEPPEGLDVEGGDDDE